MKTSSPLRYPGGKSAMTGLLSDIRRVNGLGGLGICEPFAGGAGASLSLLYREDTASISINDADPAIYSLWWSLLYRVNDFISLLAKSRVSMAEWRRQRDTYRSRSRVSRVRRGFAAFYLNRCNRSGIIMNGGPIGGVRQEGKWKLGARFNKEELKSRCLRVAEYRRRISVHQEDGVDFIRCCDPAKSFFFIDPPYYTKGPLLYLNGLDPTYHDSLAAQLRGMKNDAWVLTYDDCPQIRRLYRGWTTIRPFGMRYAAAVQRSGREIMIAPRWMRLPNSQDSAALSW